MKDIVQQVLSGNFTDNSDTTTQSNDPVQQILSGDFTSNTPSDIANANTIQGKSGWCQQFVDDAIGTPQQNRLPSADAAWQNYQATGQAVQGTQGIQPGDILYFSNNHVGIYSGGDKFISATEQDPKNPVKNQSIGAWHDITGDVPLGYVRNPSNLPQIGGPNGNIQ